MVTKDSAATSEAEPAVKITSSLAELDSPVEVQYKVIDGFATGEKLRIGSLSAADMMKWSEDNVDARTTATLRMIAAALVDADGHRYAAGENGSKISASIQILKKKNHEATERIAKEILVMNKMMSEDEIKNAKKG